VQFHVVNAAAVLSGSGNSAAKSISDVNKRNSHTFVWWSARKSQMVRLLLQGQGIFILFMHK
jgi:hypothetical protein